MLKVALDNKFGSAIAGTDFYDLVYDFSSMNGFKRYKVSIFDGPICYEVVLIYFKYMSQK